MNQLLAKLRNLTVAHSEEEECFVIQNKNEHKLIAEVSYFDSSPLSKAEAEAIANALALVPELIKTIQVIDASLHLIKSSVEQQSISETINLILSNTKISLDLLNATNSNG